MSYNFRKGATGPYAHVDHYMRHMNRATMISTIQGPMDKADSTFKVVHALCVPGENGCPEVNQGSTGCISLESINFPGYFFASADTTSIVVKLLKADGTMDFNLRASFCIQPGGWRTLVFLIWDVSMVLFMLNSMFGSGCSSG